MMSDELKACRDAFELLAAIRKVRDEYHNSVNSLINQRYGSDILIKERRKMVAALTRIIDEAEKQSVTKQVGTGSVTKTVTMTPDE